jgi:hypothetical protein
MRATASRLSQPIRSDMTGVRADGGREGVQHWNVVYNSKEWGRKVVVG